MFAPRKSVVVAVALGVLVACSSGDSHQAAKGSTPKPTTEPTVLGEVLTEKPAAQPAPADVTTTTAGPSTTTTTRPRPTTTTTRPAATTTSTTATTIPPTTTTTVPNAVVGSYAASSTCGSCAVTVELRLGDRTTVVATRTLSGDGGFSFDGLVDGSYMVRFSEDGTGYATASDNFELSGGQTHTVNCSWQGC